MMLSSSPGPAESKECQPVHYLIAQLLGIPFQLVVWLRANIQGVREFCWQSPRLRSVLFIQQHERYLPMFWRGYQSPLLHDWWDSGSIVSLRAILSREYAGNNYGERRERDMRMINFFYSDCDENQSEISDSSDFIVFPNIKWISS